MLEHAPHFYLKSAAPFLLVRKGTADDLATKKRQITLRHD